jgi:hypothetical protein
MWVRDKIAGEECAGIMMTVHRRDVMNVLVLRKNFVISVQKKMVVRYV